MNWIWVTLGVLGYVTLSILIAFVALRVNYDTPPRLPSGSELEVEYVKAQHAREEWLLDFYVTAAGWPLLLIVATAIWAKCAFEDWILERATTPKPVETPKDEHSAD